MAKVKRLFHFLLTVALLIASSHLAFAKEAPVGEVIASRGSVVAVDASGAQRTLSVKAEIFLNDTIKTDKNGRVQLLFKDNTIISLGVNAELKIAEYSWDADKQQGSMKTRLEEGTFRVIGGLITQKSPQKFVTETPAATIGIRGSMYAGKVENGNLTVVFLGGTGIYVTNGFGTIEIQIPGFGTQVKNGQPPEVPVQFDETLIRELLESLVNELRESQNRDASDRSPSYIVSKSTTDFTGDNVKGIVVTDDNNSLFNLLAEVNNLVEQIITQGTQNDNIIINDPPVAVDDFVSTEEDLVVVIDVTGNDRQAVSIAGWTVITGPGHGTLVSNGDGTFTYIPEENYVGTDTFSYQVTDSHGATGTALVSIEITGINDPPMAFDGTAVTTEDTSVDILVNATDVDGTINGWAVTSAPTHGTLADNGDGTYTYTPEADYTGVDSFTYQVSDGQQTSGLATVTIDITPVNDPPVAGNDTFSTSENTTALITVSDNDTDVEGPVGNWTVNALPEHGTLVNNGDGTFSYTPDPDYVGEDSFTYQISDSDGATTEAVVFITSINVPVVVAMEGRVMRSFTPLNGNPSDNISLDITAVSEDGVVTTTLPGGRTAEPFTMTPYDPDLTYSSVISQEDVTTVTTSSRGSFETLRKIRYDNAGEFFIVTNDDNSVALDPGNYSTVSLSFAGFPSALAELPVTGIDKYTGDLAYYYAASGYDESHLSPFSLMVNWQSDKVIGQINWQNDTATGPKAGGYFFGDLIDGNLTNIVFIGSGPAGIDPPPYDIGTLRGATTYGKVYGSDHQGIGLTATGLNDSIFDQTLVKGDWALAAGAFLEIGATQPSTSISQNWNGWFIGLADNMENPSGDRLLFKNWDHADFLMIPDNSSGEINSGYMRQGDGSIDIGGSLPSAVIGKTIVAELGATTTIAPTGYEGQGDGLTLKPYGNYLVTAAVTDQFSDYATWGYWNMALAEDSPGTAQYHLHDPGGYWIAGVDTGTSYIAGLRTSNLVGNYAGPAFGSYIAGPTATMVPLTGGYTDLNFYFAPGVIEGEIGFNQGVIALPSTTVYWDPSISTAFNAYVYDPGTLGNDVINPGVYTDISGSFFGSAANTMAGHFHSEKSTGEIFTGIFGGDLESMTQAPPSPPGNIVIGQ